MKAVPATWDHALDFLSRPIRQHDVDEWVLSGGQPVPLSLRSCLDANPDTARALMRDERCIALWGVIKEDYWPELGGVWLIVSVEAEKDAQAIHRLWRMEIELMHQHRPLLRAAVMDRNMLHHRWLNTVGFQMLDIPTPLHGFHIWERVDPNWKREGLAPCVVH